MIAMNNQIKGNQMEQDIVISSISTLIIFPRPLQEPQAVVNGKTVT